MIPVPPPRSELARDYGHLLDDLKQRIAAERVRVVLAANSAMVLLYWDIGQTILQRQAHEGWGAKVIDRLSADLREAFPDMSGLSSRNLKYMRAFAEAWPDRAIVQQVAAQIPWFHNCILLDKLPDTETRLWYARKTIENGWSRNILAMQISSQLHRRSGKAINNFNAVLPSPDSDLATQVFKDPYLFDFLGTADLRREREVEQALVDYLEKFLLELGQGFAFVGRQVPLEVGGQDFLIDLLFYHLRLRCFVVVELKAVPFDPAFVGQLNLYLSAVDDLLRHPDDNPTIGLLLCQGKDRLVVEYALRGLQQPLGVADWETQVVDHLPEKLRGTLPTVEQIEAELRASKTVQWEK
jgi:predicted nuclease of restriction endonuclease-like (RecB) superfamily